MKPDIVAPGGSLEKAKIALDFGANAVYVGSDKFSLRKSADNFTFEEFHELCKYAHAQSKRVYLALNIFPHCRDIPTLSSFLDTINDIPFDALIISDLGVCKLAKEKTSFPIHVSTQASVMNTHGAKLWADLGAKRIVLARECSLKETFNIKHKLGIETEVFIHGAMCSSFSGKCTISNVTAGRDSNRGGCIQSCRHPYSLSNGDELHIMNSKDLNGLAEIPNYFKYQIDAVKIEGRMKSALYVANAVQQYRDAIDTYVENPELFDSKKQSWNLKLGQVSNRGFTSGNLISQANQSSISYDWNGYSKSIQFMGTVKSQQKNRSLIQVKNPIKSGDQIIIISPQNKDPQAIEIECSSISGTMVPSLQPNECGWINSSIPTNSILVQ